MQVLQARTITLDDLSQEFGLEDVQDADFFPEWQGNLPELTDIERQFLDKIKAGYLAMVKRRPFLEKPVQLTVISPLLFLLDFYLPPFHIQTENSVELVEKSEGITIRGSLDILFLKEGLWLLVIESKQVQFSLESGLAQLLSYMLANLQKDRPVFGLLTNGEGFIFVKMAQDGTSKYANSRYFLMRNPGNELYEVLRILKWLGQL
ncbi:MAG: restriction endonuclease subunit R [Cyanobacteria bacterium J06638_22]